MLILLADGLAEEKTAAEIKRVYDATGYVMDTHTAVASAVYKEYKEPHRR